MKIERECSCCSTVFKTSQYRISTGRGRFCSRRCRAAFMRQRASETALDQFINKHRRTPQELSLYLAQNKLTLTAYADECATPVAKLGKHLKRFEVAPYKAPLKKQAVFYCKQCEKVFSAYSHPSRAKRNIYCSVVCGKAAWRKNFDQRQFRINDYAFALPQTAPGDYQQLELGKRQRSFVNREKVNHFFFRLGLQNEETAYIYGVLLTDGSLYRNKKGTRSVRLQITDRDIVEQISTVLRNTNQLYVHESRRATSLIITSPYLFHDLEALGCGPNKTASATYPVVPAGLDNHLLRGIIDGDGSWVLSSGGQVQLQICGNDLLMYGVYLRILHHLRVSPQSVQYPVDFEPRIKMSTFCHMRYNTSDSLLIRDWVYSAATIFGVRKYERAHAHKHPYTERMTTPKLATWLGVSPDFVKRSIRRNNLPCRQAGPYYYFEPDELPAWVAYLRNRLPDSRCKLPNRTALVERWLGADT